MSEGKVVIPKKVAEAIAFIREKTDITDHALYDYRWLKSKVDDDQDIRKCKDAILDYTEYRNDRFDDRSQLQTYFRALVNGYEVKRTPHVKLREYYESLNTSTVWEPRERKGIERTLEIFGEQYPELAELHAELKGGGHE